MPHSVALNFLSLFREKEMKIALPFDWNALPKPVKTGVLALIPTVVAVVAIRKYRRYKKRQAYPKDVVILHQFPPGLRAPSASPFVLKLETWLRMAKIEYQVCHPLRTRFMKCLISSIFEFLHF